MTCRFHGHSMRPSAAQQSSIHINTRRVAVVEMLAGLVVLALVYFLIFAVTNLAAGASWEAITSPTQWLAKLDNGGIAAILSTASQVIAGLLAIAITVSAIVVELAANRYNHRITWLFVREPTNIVVMSIFLVTTLQCVWIALTYQSGAFEDPSQTAFLITIGMITLSLVLLLPYFAFVFRFLSPLSIVDKIRRSAYRAIERGVRGDMRGTQTDVLEAIDELQDVARGAANQSDRSIAMACVTALADLVGDYQRLRENLPAPWFTSRDSFSEDPDFVSLAPSVFEDIESNRIWVEFKVFRQYISLMLHCVPHAREVANIIAISTYRVGLEHSRGNRALRELTIRSFNSYLRASINAGDARTSYYVMNQYRLFATAMMDEGFDESVRAIAQHFKFYGQLAHERGQSFLLQTAAGDLTKLVEESLDRRALLTDDLLAIVLEVDQEIRSETHERSLLGVRRAQLQLATLFAARGDEPRAKRICADLAGEEIARIERLKGDLDAELDEGYWEVTDRGTNFAYLPAERRAQLSLLMRWIREAAAPAA